MVCDFCIAMAFHVGDLYIAMLLEYLACLLVEVDVPPLPSGAPNR